MPFLRAIPHGSDIGTQGGTSGMKKGTESCSGSHLSSKLILILCFHFLFIFKNSTERRKQSFEHFHVIKEQCSFGLRREKLRLEQ